MDQDGKQHSSEPTPREKFPLFVHSSPCCCTFYFTCTLNFDQCASSDQENQLVIELSTVSGFVRIELGTDNWITRSPILRSFLKIMNRKKSSHQESTRDEPPVLSTPVLAVPTFRRPQEPCVHQTHARSAMACNRRCSRFFAVKTAGELQQSVAASVWVLLSKRNICNLLLQCLDGHGNKGRVHKQASKSVSDPSSATMKM